MSTDIIVAIEIMVSAYIVGAIVSMKADERTADLSEPERRAARTRAGIYWPRRLASWLAAQAPLTSRS